MPLFIYENSVEENVNKILKYTKRKIMAVVKSNAYGLGDSKIIPILKRAGIDYFVFEKLEEYKKCKNLFEKQNVLILESIKDYKKLDDNITYSINSAIDAYRVKNVKHQVKVHIRVDTGMNRMGLRSISELRKILRVLKSNKNIYIEGLYTHFSTDAFESKYYEKQLELFKKYQEVYDFPIIHANSTRSLNKTIIGNYVRVGIGLYGYHQPCLNLKKAVTMVVKPCSIFRTFGKTRIGYGEKYIKKEEVVGVVPIGYNDIDLKNIRFFYQNGKKYYLIGKSCMNHTHFLADDKINYLSWLSILPTNGIISSSDEYNINWYHILTSLKSVPKNYLKRRNYDIPKILKYNGEKSFLFKVRKRSN